jgi:nucleoside-diphosphate-sugar epimerase
MTSAVILGCGYVGRAVAQCWRPSFYLTVTTTSAPKLSLLEPLADRVVLVNGNDEAGLRSLLHNQEVLLLSLGAPQRDAYADTYLRTAQTLATVLPDCPTLRQIIYTSSYALYGDHGGEWVDETTPIQPTNPNGKILAETEQVLLGLATPQRAVCVLRLGGIYGPGRELITIFRRSAGTTRPGTGAEASNWVHLDDIVGAIAFAAQHHLTGVYNLVATVPLTVKELLDQVLTAHGLPCASWDAGQRSERSYNAKVSNAKLRAAGYAFAHPTVQG